MDNNSSSRLDKYAKELLQMYNLNKKNNANVVPTIDKSLKEDNVVKNENEPIDLENRSLNGSEKITVDENNLNASDQINDEMYKYSNNIISDNLADNLPESENTDSLNNDQTKIYPSSSVDNAQNNNAPKIDKSIFPTRDNLSDNIEYNTKIYNNPTYDNLEEFEKNNPSNGFIKVEVRVARGALPISGVVCTIYKEIGDEKHIFHTATTDESGNTSNMAVPTPDISESYTPIGKRPYQTYTLELKKDGYRTEINKNLSVLPGILSIQPVLLQPLPAGSSANIGPDIVIEEQWPNL